MNSHLQKHKDPQTGEEFDVVPENTRATWSARVTGIYAVIFLLRMLLQIGLAESYVFPQEIDEHRIADA
jgi:hypothetical protein